MAGGSASMSTMGRIRLAGGVASGSAWRSACSPAMTVSVSGSVSRQAPDFIASEVRPTIELDLLTSGAEMGPIGDNNT